MQQKNNVRNLYGKDEEHYIRTLAKYYPLNEETNTFEIALRYEKASDLFDENTDSLDMAPRISDSIIDKMSDIPDDIPKGCSTDFSIRVDDYEGQVLEESDGGNITGLTFIIGFIMYYIQYRQDRIGKQ